MRTYRAWPLPAVLVLSAVATESCTFNWSDDGPRSASAIGRDSAVDSTVDTPTATDPMQTSSDGGAAQGMSQPNDVASDAASDATLDAAPDATSDAASDAARDAASDAASDAARDAASDAAIDAAIDAASDAASTPSDGGGSMEAGSGDAATTEQGLRCQADAALAQNTDYGKPGPYAVGTLDLTFSDTARPIVATEHHAAAAVRALPTRVYYPAASAGQSTPLGSGKPFPMLMYSHGYSSNNAESATSGNRAASHGYIVVAPTFPLTSQLSSGADPDTRDIPNQPGDISFLIDRMIELSKDPSHVFAGAVDADRIGALGVSTGGLTTLLVSLHAKYHDPRIQAAMPVAPLAAFLEQPYYSATRTLPLLFVQGDVDAFMSYRINGLRGLEKAQPNARLVTIARGSHTTFASSIDQLTLGLIAPVLVPIGWSWDNPDATGCATTGSVLQKQALAVLETLEGPHVDRSLTLEGDDVVCQGSELTMPAMGIDEQRGILAASVVSFFDAHFGATEQRRHDGCRYLLYELPKNPAVTLR